MKPKNLTKDQIQKIVLSALGFVALIYCYFNFFLGPLNKRRASMIVTIADVQAKIASSKAERAQARATRVCMAAPTRTTTAAC